MLQTDMGRAVKVLVLSPLMYRGKPHARGTVLSAPPLDAWQLVSSGRAKLADAERDGAAVHDAVQAFNACATRNARRGPHPAQQTGGGPWRRVSDA